MSTDSDVKMEAASSKRPATTEAGSARKVAKHNHDLLPEDEQGRLKWRGDPADTFSDWTVEVVSEGALPESAAPAGDSTPASKKDKTLVSPSPKGKKGVVEIGTQTQTYHLHRYFLGFGTRRSEYFTKIFKQGKGNITKLDLEPLAANAFPALLDFLYEPGSTLAIETGTATALHSLGIKLEMKHLEHYAKQFITKDIDLTTFEVYYEHAKLLEDELVIDSVVKFVGKNIASIDSDSTFVTNQTDADFWKNCMSHVTHTANMSTDVHLSKIIAEFGSVNKDKLDAATFQDLTSERQLRKIDPSVAMDLCALEDEFGGGEEGLSSLQKRCAAALAETWKDLDTNDEHIKTRSAGFLVELLTKCLDEARKENETLGGAKSVLTPTVRGRKARAAQRAERVESRSESRSRR